MASKHFKFVVIGGGSAGYAAARTARQYHDSVAIIDNGGGYDALGGLCILRGCMPSKTLIYSAEVLHLAKNAKLFGLDIPSAQANMKALHERKKKIIGEFAQYRQEQLQDDRFTLIQQKAKFIDPDTLMLEDGSHISADKFLVSTGSVIDTPPILGLADTPHLTSDDILDLDTLPESTIVLGGGVVACELAQFLSRIGSKVTQIQRSPNLLKNHSTQSTNVIAQAFRDEGIELFTETSIKKISHVDDQVIVTFDHKGETITRTATTLFNALGRSPNIANLGLDKAGVTLHPSRHIAVNEFQQTDNPKIYAAGDCTGPHEIVHIAILQGELVANHAFGDKDPTPIHYQDLVSIVFTDPQIGVAGLTEKQLKAENIPYISAEYPFNDHGKSILMEAKYGYVKIFASPQDGCLLGAECVSKDASELIHSLAVGITLRATAAELLRTHWYHPTLSEIWTYPLEDINDQIEQ